MTTAEVVTCAELGKAPLVALLARYGLSLEWLDSSCAIPGSYWGDSEAGLIGAHLLVRGDTPVHSALHETGHYVCMDAHRRGVLHTDAGGDDAEENGVCYLQVLLADYLPGFDRLRLFADMDTWGYSFRLGSACAWFEHDAEDARAWLLHHRLIGADGRPNWRLRQGRG